MVPKAGGFAVMFLRKVNWFESHRFGQLRQRIKPLQLDRRAGSNAQASVAALLR
jgi:hypothetical protein